MQLTDHQISMVVVLGALRGLENSNTVCLRIYCDICEKGYEDVDMKYIDGEWNCWADDNEEWWPISRWSMDNYSRAEIISVF